ncbi:hypothetical protein BGZ95_006667 [Linnemannia exigua]|uniref:ABC transporter domain-containing protein n=1 Tax=Linnemannia exigua TaxID=604196 RepID=A0AAD4DHK5_9FUNG|nr:hypothetical protein BGZ95_006667 [Linnemannia exigua]
MYIPQRTTIMEGTPLEFLEEVRAFSAHKHYQDAFDDPVQIGLDWGIRPHLWHKKWNTLSGGEMQRISLAIGCSFRPEILLLDELVMRGGDNREPPLEVSIDRQEDGEDGEEEEQAEGRRGRLNSKLSSASMGTMASSSAKMVQAGGH